jgi:hypothetical protein
MVVRRRKEAMTWVHVLARLLLEAELCVFKLHHFLSHLTLRRCTAHRHDPNISLSQAPFMMVTLDFQCLGVERLCLYIRH